MQTQLHFGRVIELTGSRAQEIGNAIGRDYSTSNSRAILNIPKRLVLVDNNDTPDLDDYLSGLRQQVGIPKSFTPGRVHPENTAPVAESRSQGSRLKRFLGSVLFGLAAVLGSGRLTSPDYPMNQPPVESTKEELAHIARKKTYDVQFLEKVGERLEVIDTENLTEPLQIGGFTFDPNA